LAGIPVSVMRSQSGKLNRQHAHFPQRGKFAQSSAPLFSSGNRARSGCGWHSSSACLIGLNVITGLEMFPFNLGPDLEVGNGFQVLTSTLSCDKYKFLYLRPRIE